ncbi:helicase-related protein [Leptospirillum ferriphilum]|uniref:Helicase conserved C-terminal domain protein n=1 Tax=Leptospirillum ferriphilum (strain ML-04) TaxID=1048260 RepID=J9Z718_LEPFM|nr:helicase-related protein [Leptospirillum ferriphilum]AFS52280.1 helicase conserved C-terminal domain protein [Leptospirillum ferriphilum ML-04]
MEKTLIPGTLVHLRGRDWTVLPDSRANVLRLRPLGGSEEDASLIYLPLEKEKPAPAQFQPPDPNQSGSQDSTLLLRDAMRLKLRAGAGPFRSIGNLGFEPRAYQLVPLLMALKLDPVRLLIADDVGVGKTIEAGLIARELLDRGDIQRLSVICPPHLCDQWEEELRTKFFLQATVVQSRTAPRLERGLPADRSLFEEYPITIVSLDYIKSEKRLSEFSRACPEFVIVEEAHTCVRSGGGVRHQRYKLLHTLYENPDRHLVFLTATPHSGDEEAFYHLLGLLNPQFEALRDATERERENLRDQLSRHFVQRRRPDIDEWKDSTVFPDRQSRELTYTMTGEWKTFFDRILTYARTLVEDPSSPGTLGKRLNWWAALALLRCASSSPEAAAMALSTRLEVDRSPEMSSEESIELFGRNTILDGDDSETILSDDDRVPGSQTAPNPEIEDLIQRAIDLRGPKKDPKLSALLPEIQKLLQEGFHPVIFCRYIATAHYLAEYLKEELGKGVSLDAITGELSPEEREERITELGEKSQGSRILVATDCLSEGINLQRYFDAVIHYDLSWNPTRHEQREGRVDRFGQPKPSVRVILYYGANNPVDGAVLKVILRKANQIRKELGVSVPFPTDSDKILKAVMEAAFFKSPERPKYVQGRLMFKDDPLEEMIRKTEDAWESARENASKLHTIFAQQRLRPADVLPEWDRTRRILGDHEDVHRFVSQAALRLQVPLKENGDEFRWEVEALPPVLRDSFREIGIGKELKGSFKPGISENFLHRAHPVITILADYLSEMALSGDSGGLVSRSGAIFTREVTQRTILLLLRFRNQIFNRRKGRTHTLLAEEVQIAGVKGSEPPVLLSPEESALLLQVSSSRNLDPEQRRRLVTEALARLHEWETSLREIAEVRARELSKDHQRVLEASRVRSGEYEVHPSLPPDVIGLTILMPDRSGGER